MPRPPPWRTLLVATSLTASTRSSPRVCAEAGRACAAGDEVPQHRRDRRRRRRARAPAPRGSGSGSANGVAERVEPAVGAARRGARRRRRSWDGCECAPAITLGVERARVVRAQQRERRRLGEREVEQRLVPLALDELGLAAARPDRLADAPDRAAAARLRASRNCFQAGMRRAGCRRSRACRRTGRARRRAAAPTRAARSCRCRRPRAPARRPRSRADERQRAGQELLVAGVQQRVVPERLRRNPRGGDRRSRGSGPLAAGSRPKDARARAGRKSGTAAPGWCLRLPRLGIPAFRPQPLAAERGAARVEGWGLRESERRPAQPGERPRRSGCLRKPDQVPVARRAVAEFCERCGLPAPLIDDVKLVVTEACTNVVLHAYDGRSPPDRTFELSAHLEQARSAERQRPGPGHRRAQPQPRPGAGPAPGAAAGGRRAHARRRRRARDAPDDALRAARSSERSQRLDRQQPVLGVLPVEAAAASHSERWLPWAGKPPAPLSICARCIRFQVMNVVLRLVKSFSGPPEPGIEVGRARARLADPAGVGLGRDRVAEVLEACRGRSWRSASPRPRCR